MIWDPFFLRLLSSDSGCLDWERVLFPAMLSILQVNECSFYLPLLRLSKSSEMGGNELNYVPLPEEVLKSLIGISKSFLISSSPSTRHRSGAALSSRILYETSVLRYVVVLLGMRFSG